MSTRVPADTLPTPTGGGRLAVGEGHVIAWQEFGAPEGLPALVLHGGPGSALTPGLVRFFDLARWRVIGFDQRGCGASTPRGETADNDSARLIEDIERLRLHVDVPRWLVVGGSWGATLALAYAARRPQAVSGLLLRALFVPEAEELRWFFHDAGPLAPETWKHLAGLAPPQARDDLLPWLAEVFAHGAPALQSRVALAWLAWEHALAVATQPDAPDLQLAVDRYRIQSHYLAHGCWLAGGALHAAARTVPRVPVRFLHGEADVVCRPAAAQLVHRLIAGSRFDPVPHAGHDPTHPAMVAAMRTALAEMADGEKDPA